MLSDISIGTRLAIGFGFVVLLLIAVSIIGLFRMSEINNEVTLMNEESFPKTVLANDIIDAINMAALIYRNAVLASDHSEVMSELDRIPPIREVALDRLAKLERLVHSPQGRRYLGAVKDARDRFLVQQKQLLTLLDSGRRDEAIKLMTGSLGDAQDDYIRAVADLVKHQTTQMVMAGQTTEAAYHSARLMMVSLGATAIVLATVLGVWIVRSITRPIRAAARVANQLAAGDLSVQIEVNSRDETGQLMQAMQTMIGKLVDTIGEVRRAADALTETAGEVSSTAQSLSHASSEQAAAVEQTRAAMNEMAAAIARNTQNAEMTNGMASTMFRQAESGADAVTATVDAVRQIAACLGIVDEIATQTRMLAVNSAIEASRLGELGSGFAVVAAEVRTLASQSQAAAQEIDRIARKSVDLAENAVGLLREILPAIHQTSDLVQEITLASQVQSAEVTEINGAMTQLSSATQQNAWASGELAATANALNDKATHLRQVMTFFRLDGV